jgi:precorrin-6A/cobalt-precorrin-6A reductase
VILLIGGTSETREAASAIAHAGFSVLVSTATDIDLALPDHPKITRRCGRLSAGQFADLIRAHDVRAVVDVSHPYAVEVKIAAYAAAKEAAIPYIGLTRPTSAHTKGDVHYAPDHETAGRVACALGRPILLTVGSKHVGTYAVCAREAGVPLFARVLDHPDSISACERAGVPEDRIIAGRGPFSVEANLALIRAHEIGTLVTKDSGAAGGAPEKMEAAALSGCAVIVVERPSGPDAAMTVNDTADLPGLLRTLLADPERSPE